MPAPASAFRSLLAASLLARTLSDLRTAEEQHDEDAALTLEVAFLLQLAALRILSAEQADVTAMARAALSASPRGGTLRDAVAPAWAAATRVDGAFRARWRRALAPVLRDALTRVSAQFGGSLDPRTVDALAAERADLAAYRLGRTTASKVTTALREMARAGVTDPADPRIGYRIGHAVDGRGRMDYPAPFTAALEAPPRLAIGPLVFRDRTLPALPVVRPVQRAAAVSKHEAGIVATGTFLAANAAGFNRVSWRHDGNPMEPRPVHLGLNGFVVPLGETFPGTDLRYPRDPEADVSSTAGCTCSARYFKA